MGQIKLLKCSHCGNTWEHWEGVGMGSAPVKGDKTKNMTGNGDGKICCPKCGTEYQEGGNPKIVALWD